MTPVGDPIRAILRWLPALLWMGLIFVLSAQAGLRVSEDASVDEPLRNIAHLGTYAVLGGLLLFALAGREPTTPMAATLAFGIAIIYGISDEIHQSFVPERSGQIADVLADAIGAALGVTLAWRLVRRRRHRRPG